MEKMDNTKKGLLALVQAGLWEKEDQLFSLEDVDYLRILELAELQGVVGLVAAGIEHVSDVKVPQACVLQFIGSTLQIEQRNEAMTKFTVEAVEKMRATGLNPLLVKGQGVGQCYERPLWRSSGDIDFFFSWEDYPKAVELFTSWSGNVVQNSRYTRSFGVVKEQWFIEVHGTLRSTLSSRQVREIDAVQKDTFDNRKFRVWKNGDVDIYLPEANNDLFFVFTHFVRHFYKEGMNLRQLCDWCRLLWVYRSEIDGRLLEERLHRAGLLEEWKAFAAVAVGYLGMPVEAMPLFDESDNEKLKRKAERIMCIILAGSTGSTVKDTWRIAKVFPWHTIQFSPSIFFHLNWLKVKERVFSVHGS